ncbi:MAG: ligase-associated DNA damage response endonuclease PdeM [Chitinophagales bacterium]|nr:ligase-associated DNA damage response endonuclease PdeM [Chitinophagales bacterium]
MTGIDQKHELLGETFTLSPHKAMHWDRKKTLILGDLHLGKTNYFRKMGIQVPQDTKEKNWAKLRSLLIQFRPERVLFLGDLFHSRRTSDFERLGKEIEKNPNVSFELIKGNHDILKKEWYTDLNIKLHDPVLKEAPFLFTHEEIEDSQLYPISAHVHPAVKFRGSGRQSVSLACFYFGEKGAIIPAFGSFTGYHTIRPVKTESVYVVLPDKVMKVN